MHRSIWITPEASVKLRYKYPTHVPIVVQPLRPTGGIAFVLKKSKFIVPQSTQMGSLFHIIRQYIDGITETTGLFFYVKNAVTNDLILSPVNFTVGEIDIIYNSTSSTKPLEVWVGIENTFGSII